MASVSDASPLNEHSVPVSPHGSHHTASMCSSSCDVAIISTTRLVEHIVGVDVDDDDDDDVKWCGEAWSRVATPISDDVRTSRCVRPLSVRGAANTHPRIVAVPYSPTFDVMDASPLTLSWRVFHDSTHTDDDRCGEVAPPTTHSSLPRSASRHHDVCDMGRRSWCNATTTNSTNTTNTTTTTTTTVDGKETTPSVPHFMSFSCVEALLDGDARNTSTLCSMCGRTPLYTGGSVIALPTFASRKDDDDEDSDDAVDVFYEDSDEDDDLQHKQRQLSQRRVVCEAPGVVEEEEKESIINSPQRMSHVLRTWVCATMKTHTSSSLPTLPVCDDDCCCCCTSPCPTTISMADDLRTSATVVAKFPCNTSKPSINDSRSRTQRRMHDSPMVYAQTNDGTKEVQMKMPRHRITISSARPRRPSLGSYSFMTNSGSSASRNSCWT